VNQTNSTTLQKTRQHLSICERKEIEKSLKKGFSVRAIAKALNRSPSTISREIKRGSVEQRFTLKTNKKYAPLYETRLCYYYDAGERVAEANLKKRGGKYKIGKDVRLAEYITNCILKDKLSPDAIIGRLRKFRHTFETMVCTKTVYNYIDKGIIGVKSIDLLLKVKRKKRNPGERRKKLPRYGKSIDERTAEVLSRKTFGHYEGDTIVGAGNKSAVLTMIERKTGKGFLFKIDGKTADEVYRAISEAKLDIKTLTLDNGSEFASCGKLPDIDVYYAHPYSAWERGANENFNGIVRRFLPKGTDLSKYTQEELNAIADVINNMPRKRLHYFTANEMYALSLETANG